MQHRGCTPVGRSESLVNRRQVLGGIAGTGAAAALTGGLPLRAGLTAAQDAAPSGEISYWHHFTSESEMQGLDQAVQSFQAEYPEVTVSLENIPNADYMTQLTTASVGGGLPDTLMAAIDRIPDMIGLGALADLTERFNAWEGKSNFPETVMPGATIDGKVYGVPAFMFVSWLYYRKDWFEEAGIAEPPTTWDEFREVAIALTDPSQNRYGFGLRGGDGGQTYVIDIMRAYGGLYLDDSGQPVIERDPAIEAVAYWAGLFTTDKVAPPSAPNDSYRQIMEAFRTGQTGMLLHHTGSLQEILSSLTTDQVMTALVPAGPVMRVAGVSPLYNGMASTENEEAAWAWLTHWGETDVAVQFLETTGYFPASTAAANDPRVTGNPIYGAAVETLSVGVLGLQFPGAPGWASTSVLPAFQQVLTGQATAEEAVDQMITGLEEAVG